MSVDPLPPTIGTSPEHPLIGAQEKRRHLQEHVIEKGVLLSWSTRVKLFFHTMFKLLISFGLLASSENFKREWEGWKSGKRVHAIVSDEQPASMPGKLHEDFICHLAALTRSRDSSRLSLFYF